MRKQLIFSFSLLLPIISCSSNHHIHTNYGGLCLTCGEVVNGLHFERHTVNKMPGLGYPRIIRLKNNDLLYGADIDNGAGTFLSSDNGITWSEPVLFTLFEDPNISKYYNCTNTDLIQLDNGDIIASYRSVPNDEAAKAGAPYKYDYSMRSSISHDGGKSWEYFAKIASIYDVDDYSDQQKVRDIVDNNPDHGGLWEPFAYQVGNKILSYYSDDFGGWYDASPEDHEFQYLCCKELDLNNKKWINRHICINGLKIKTDNPKLPQVTSRDGMPVVAKMHNGKYVMAFEGTYRRNDKIKHPFITLLSHSDDGINWSDPVEIYRPYGVGSKSGAAYIDVTSDDRLVVTFQTDEDYQERGGTEMGEPHSITKVMISDGTPLENIDRSSFYTAQDVFHEDHGFIYNSLWPMAAVEGDYVYAYSGGKMNYSKIGKIDSINSYHKEIALDRYQKVKGDFIKLENNYYRSKDDDNLLLNESSRAINHIEVDVFSRIRNTCGLIFNYSPSTYYTFTIDEDRGSIKLNKFENNTLKTLAINNKIRDSFTYDPNNLYKLKIEIKDHTISGYVNNDLFISYNDDNLINNGQYGYYAQYPGAVFSEINL